MLNGGKGLIAVLTSIRLTGTDESIEKLKAGESPEEVIEVTIPADVNAACGVGSETAVCNPARVGVMIISEEYCVGPIIISHIFSSCTGVATCLELEGVCLMWW